MAQEDDAKPSFEDFRRTITKGYSQFRNDMLRDYDRFMEGVWKEFEAFAGEEKYTAPKPVSLPKPPAGPPADVRQTPVAPGARSVTPAPLPSKPNTAPPALHPSDNSGETSLYSFPFYRMVCQVPQWEPASGAEKMGEKDYSGRWRGYTQLRVAERVLPSLKAFIGQHRLNDWFAIELIRSYADHLLAQSPASSRLSLAHYLLLHYGLEARLGQLENGAPLLLIPFAQTVYARPFTDIGGKRYYLFQDSRSAGVMRHLRFYTYELPAGAAAGRVADLTIRQEMKIPFEGQRYSFRHGQLSIEGEINANLRQMLHHYPQTTPMTYARSLADGSLRSSIVAQLKRQLAGKPLPEAVDGLLAFVQHSFSYATDDEQHGFEKPYFFEELLLYPACDCEDRSVFYSYLLTHVLGVDNLMVGYPGHAAVAVSIEGCVGTNFTYQGKRYYISDPTYIGAVTGQCMPQFEHEQPVIELD